MNVALALSLCSRGIPAEARVSFGLDVAAIDTYLDLTDPTAGKVLTLRMALGDFPHALAAQCVDIFEQWARR